jgi:hypothetical protein
VTHVLPLPEAREEMTQTHRRNERSNSCGSHGDTRRIDEGCGTATKDVTHEDGLYIQPTGSEHIQRASGTRCLQPILPREERTSLPLFIQVNTRIYDGADEADLGP